MQLKGWNVFLSKRYTFGIITILAGVERIELPVAVLETAGLPLTDTPMGKIDYTILCLKTTKKA